jgi:colanic acid/amylovoran biosynthesis glycosyltransferase
MAPGRSGFLVPERSAEALAERLAFMAGHAQMWPEWGRAGREYVEKRYDLRDLNSQLERLYRQVIEAYGAGERRR